MINRIIGFHNDLEEGEYLELMTKLKEPIYIRKTDTLEKKVYVLVITNSNGRKIAIDTDNIVWCLRKE